MVGFWEGAFRDADKKIKQLEAELAECQEKLELSEFCADHMAVEQEEIERQRDGLADLLEKALDLWDGTHELCYEHMSEEYIWMAQTRDLLYQVKLPQPVALASVQKESE